MAYPSEQSNFDFDFESQKTFEQLLPRLLEHFEEVSKRNPEEWSHYIARLKKYFNPLFRIYVDLYSERYDFFFYLESLLINITNSWLNRSDPLKDLDALREEDPDWFNDHRMLGGVCYVDLFAGDLSGIQEKIPYFKELGLTYLHLMPLFKSPEGENDGGYAISSYREVNPKLGTMAELRELADKLREEGISLVLDFVFNHTSNEHEWALKAREGIKRFQNYYWMFPDRTIPNAYEKHLREIFPDEHPGAFTYFYDIGMWVWTTFHSNQWDLNYANPEVFNQMAQEMLFLANQGVEVLRLDAVAFIWKEMGTSCENLPEAHSIIQAYNLIARIAAPALLFKSEAIVHPDEVAKYIHPEECQLSYNPLLMALLWNTLATREVNLLLFSMKKRSEIPEDCTWVNYVRCHDDIGWTFSDEDAADLWVNAFDHRQFLNAFYTGGFEGSFARGLPFQENPKTKDARISGTTASLAGLEKALEEETGVEVELAIRRIHLIHNIIFSIGGIPLIYLGDEVGMLNDYTYQQDPDKADDSRWVHRPKASPECYAKRKNEDTIPGRIYQGFQKLIQLRKTNPILSGDMPDFIYTGNPHVFGYIRKRDDQQIMFLNNFSDDPQRVALKRLNLFDPGEMSQDIVTGEMVALYKDLELKPFQFLWLKIATLAS